MVVAMLVETSVLLWMPGPGCYHSPIDIGDAIA